MSSLNVDIRGRMRSMLEASHYIRDQDPDTRLTYCTIRKLVRDGKIKSVKVGRTTLVNLDEILEISGGAKRSAGTGRRHYSLESTYAVDREKFNRALSTRGLYQQKVSLELGYGKNYMCNVGYYKKIKLSVAHALERKYGISPSEYVIGDVAAEPSQMKNEPHVSETKNEQRFSESNAELRAQEYRMKKIVIEMLKDPEIRRLLCGIIEEELLNMMGRIIK